MTTKRNNGIFTLYLCIHRVFVVLVALLFSHQAHAQTATGGTVSDITVGGVDYRVHTFTSGGTLTVTGTIPTVEYLIVGGGGGGGEGGGGAGGVLTGSVTNITGTNAVIVGAGGAGDGGVGIATPRGNAGNGGDSSVFSITSIGGGGGGFGNSVGSEGADGGSGGGGSFDTTFGGGAGTAGQGNGGGVSSRNSFGAGGGGGGAGGAGTNATNQSNTVGRGGNGGDGIASDINGTSTFYGGGGGGGVNSNSANATDGGLGGQGGGGAGARAPNGAGADGVVNTGGGGGGSDPEGPNGGSGGSGIVIVRYEIPTVSGPGPTSPTGQEVLAIVTEETVRDLRSDLDFNRRAQRAARDRYATMQNCRRLEEGVLQDPSLAEEFEAECDAMASVLSQPLTFDGKVNIDKQGQDLEASFFGSSADGSRQRFFFGDIDVTRFDNGDVTASLNGRSAWEHTTAEDVLLGVFLGGKLAYSAIDQSLSGSRRSYGISTGVYFVDQINENLVWDGFASLAFGQNDLDMNNAASDVDGDYSTTSALFGLAVSGHQEFERFDLYPELSISYGYSDIGDVSLDVTTAGTTLQEAFDAGDVELGSIEFRPEFVFQRELNSQRFDESNITVAPNVACEYVRTTTSDTDCGGGIDLEWNMNSADGLRTFSAQISRDVIGGDSRDSATFTLQTAF